MSSSKRTNCDKIEFFSKLHESNFFLLNVFKNLLKFGEFDCILSVENKSYPVHKLVLASCSPFLATFLFKFPSLVKVELVYSHLRPADILQLLSFLYYGHAIVSNHRRAKSRLARFSSLLTLLAINNLDYRDSTDGRFLLQSVQQYPFTELPNTVSLDFRVLNVSHEPRILLSDDRNLDLSQVLNRNVRHKPQPISLISIEPNGQVTYETGNVVENGDDGVDYSSQFEVRRSNLAGSRSYSASSNSSSQCSSSHDGNTPEDDVIMNASGDFRDALSPPEREILVENCSDITNDNMDGVLSFVGNVVDVETSEENVLSNVETEAIHGGTETTPDQCGETDKYRQVKGVTRDGVVANIEKEKNRNDGKFEGSSPSPTDKKRSNEASDGHSEKENGNLDVNFDDNFKPIVIAENAIETWKVVRAGKSMKNNCYVTVLEKEHYETSDEWTKDNIPNSYEVKKGMKRDMHDQRNANRERGRRNESRDQETEALEITSKPNNASYQNDNVQCSTSTLPARHDHLDEKFVRSKKNNRKDLKREYKEKSRRHAYDTDTSDDYFSAKKSPIHSIESENHSNEVKRYKETRNNQFKSPVTENEDSLSTMKREAQAHKAKCRDNIQLLIEASHALLDTKHDMSSPSPRQYYESSRAENGSSNTWLKTKRSSLISSRPKRKQVLNERTCDSDVDFYDEKDRTPPDENSRKRKPYRRSLRRLDFNTFAHKRVKNEPTRCSRNFTTVNKLSRAESSFPFDDVANDVSSLCSPPLGIPTKLSDVQRCDPFKRTIRTLAPKSLADQTFSSPREDTYQYNRSELSTMSADSVRSTSVNEDREHTISNIGDRASSENERKVTGANLSGSDFGDDSEATVSVDEFATSPECFDDGSREASKPHQFRASVTQTMRTAEQDSKYAHHQPPQMEYEMEVSDSSREDDIKMATSSPLEDEFKTTVSNPSREEFKMEVPQDDESQPCTGRADRQLIKEYALRKLGLLFKKCEAIEETVLHEEPPFQGHSSNGTTRRDDLETHQSRDAIQGRRVVDDNPVNPSDHGKNEEFDDSSSEEDANKNGRYSFNNVYRQMRAIHGSRDRVRREKMDARNEEVDSDESDGNFVDNTDEDVDWDPSCEDAGSEDSDENVTQKRMYGGGASVNGAHQKKRSVGNHGYRGNHANVGNHANGVKSEDSDESTPRSSVDGYPGNGTRNIPNDFEGTVYYCTPCNRRYHTKTGFSQHKRFECGKPPAFECLICAKEFNRKSSLKRHLRQIHKTGLSLNVNCVVHFEKLSPSAEVAPNGFPEHFRSHSRSSGSSGSTSSEEDVRPPKRRRGLKAKACGPLRQTAMVLG